MILFSILTAALVFIALMFLLPPLMGKNRNKQIEKEALQARKALKDADDAERKRIAEELLTSLEDDKSDMPSSSSRIATLVVALLVPLLALGMYMRLGTPALISGKAVATAPTASHGGSAATMAQMIVKLEEKLQQDPGNSEGWYMLARSYVSQKQFAKAAEAMGKVIAIEGENDPQLLLQYADSLAMANQGRVAGKPEAMIQKALALKPDYPEALWLAGIAQSQNNQHAEAIKYWRKAAALLSDQPESLAELQNQIAQAEKKLEAMGAAIPAAPTTTTLAAAPGNAREKPGSNAAAGSISVTVSLSPEMRSKVEPGDSVFIYARAASGPPMPLAATRTSIGDLPVTVTLDDSQAMTPQMRLSSFDQIIVGARVSKSGQALPQPGDLEGISTPISITNQPSIAVTIDRVR